MALQGVKNQEFLLKVIAENLTNADATAKTPGGDPYAGKQVVLENKHDSRSGINTVQVKDVVRDKTPFPQEYDPAHPAADQNGMVKKSNVNPIKESVNMIEVKNSQKAMLRVFTEGTTMRRAQLDLMR